MQPDPRTEPLVANARSHTRLTLTPAHKKGGIARYLFSLIVVVGYYTADFAEYS